MKIDKIFSSLSIAYFELKFAGEFSKLTYNHIRFTIKNMNYIIGNL